MVTKTQCTFAGTSKGQEVARIRCFWYACLKRNTVRYVKEMRSGEMYFRGNVNRKKMNRGSTNTRTGTIPPILSRFAIFYDFKTVKIRTFASDFKTVKIRTFASKLPDGIRQNG
jgi:hypothetical protein